MKWPCESTHHITVTFDGVEPINITLPFPVLLSSIIKPIVLPEKGGAIEVLLQKALYDLWPEDIIQDRLRWIPEKLAPWTDAEALSMHLSCQFSRNQSQKSENGIKIATDTMTNVREIICNIFQSVIGKGNERFQLKVNGSTDSPDWFIRAHPPVRTSPHGTPILLLSALDHHLQERLLSEGKWDIDRAKKSFHRIFGHVAAENKVVISMESAEVAQIVRFI